jgi:hypothetical protein
MMDIVWNVEMLLCANSVMRNPGKPVVLFANLHGFVRTVQTHVVQMHAYVKCVKSHVKKIAGFVKIAEKSG